MTNIFYLALIIYALSLFGCHNNTASKLIPFYVGHKQVTYINRQGKAAFETQFSNALCFSEGLAIASPLGEHPGTGFINEKGVFVIQPVYSDAAPFNEGIAFVYADKTSIQAIDKTGKVLFSLPGANIVSNFSEGLAPFAVLSGNDLKWGFVDKKGKVVIAAQYADTRQFQGDACAVMDENNKWGLVDKNGKLIVNYQFDDIEYSSDGKWTAAMNKKYGVININGKFIVNPQFDDIMFDRDMLIIKQNNKWGWANKDGNIIIEPQFDHTSFFGDSKYTAVAIQHMWGYINKKGEMLIEPRYNLACAFDGDMAWVSETDYTGFINKKGDNVFSTNGFITFDYPYFGHNNVKVDASIFTVKNGALNNAPRYVALNYLYALTLADSMYLKPLLSPGSYRYMDSLCRIPHDTKELNNPYMKTKTIIKNIKESKDSACVTYNIPADPKDKILVLIKQNGTWLVDINK